MATTPDSPAPRAQRAWRAACPQCGAAVEFASAASASAVCSFCRSTLLRDGESLQRIGESAELFDDHSPLQLGVRGQWQGVPFSLVGRLQYGYEEGTWNEWFALFERDDGRQKPAWLSEDNGAYVLAFDQPTPQPWPQPQDLKPGLRRQVGPQVWSVASAQRVQVRAAQGELPWAPKLQGPLWVADLRNEAGEVGTLDYSDPTRPRWAVGRSVVLADLRLSGLREGEAEKNLAGSRSFSCPSCGGALAPTLATTRSLSCPHCLAVVDVSQGVGAELQHFAQKNGGAGAAEPLIPLGRSAVLSLGTPKPQAWQVVGFQERCDLPGPDDDEQTFWSEYLLYNRQLGFAFLVDTDEGWSWMKPLTGAPKVRDTWVNWGGRRYQQRWSYRAKVTWVQGEFYWKVTQGEVAGVTDYQGPNGWMLSCEHTANEVLWSEGQRLEADVLAKAFKLDAAQRDRMRRDASPLAGLGADAGLLRRVRNWLIVLMLVVLAVVLFRACSRDECDDTRRNFGEQSPEHQQCLRQRGSSGSRGGSWGGYSSGGGGHK